MICGPQQNGMPGTLSILRLRPLEQGAAAAPELVGFVETGGQIPRSFCIVPPATPPPPAPAPAPAPPPPAAAAAGVSGTSGGGRALLVVGNQESDSVRSFWINDYDPGDDADAGDGGGSAGGENDELPSVLSYTGHELQLASPACLIYCEL